MDPRARVEAFIADFAAARQMVAPLRREDRFDEWDELVKELGLTHGTSNFLDFLGGPYGVTLNYSPKECQVVGVQHDDSSAVVQVSRPRGYEFIEFFLETRDGDWRINEALEYLDPPDSPLLDEEQYRRRHAELEGLPDFAPLGEQDRANPSVLFQEGPALVPLSKEETTQVELQVHDLGGFPITGRVAVGDWAYAEDFMGVLNRSISAQEVRAQAATVTGERICSRVVGLRIVLGDEPVASWHRALIGDGGAYAVNVGAGMAGIFDAERYFAMSTRDWTRATYEFTQTLTPRIVVDGGVPIGVVTSSGWGDGTYGVYWGCDASGDPAQLVIDYSVLAH